MCVCTPSNFPANEHEPHHVLPGVNEDFAVCSGQLLRPLARHGPLTFFQVSIPYLSEHADICEESFPSVPLVEMTAHSWSLFASTGSLRYICFICVEVMCGVCGEWGSEETESFGKRPDHQCCGGCARCCRGQAMHTCERKRVFCERGKWWRADAMRDEAACDQLPIFFHKPSRHKHVFLSICIGLRYE